MKKSNKRWSDEEIYFLKSNTNKTSFELCKQMNRTRKAIHSKCKSLEIKLKTNYVRGKASTKKRESERRRKISETMKKNPKAGGLRKGSGRGIKGWYKGYWCDSSYELAWVIYNLEHDIKFERSWDSFKYVYNGEESFYYPDFKIKDTYYEIKGYMTEKVKSKIDQFPVKYKLVVLSKTELKDIFEYVIEQYGKNYVTLYDESNLRTCKTCGGYIYRRNQSGYCRSCFDKNKKKITDKKRERKYKKDLCSCGNEKIYTSDFCKKCYDINQRKVKNRPDLKTLIEDVNNLGYTGTGRNYNVSDTTIRKWIKFMESKP